MIALLPSRAGDAQEAPDPKTPGQHKPVLGKQPGAPPARVPDFASWVDKALAELPDTSARAKSAKEKSTVKPSSNDKDDKANNPSASDAASVLGVEAPPPPPPLPLPKLGGHSAPVPHHAALGIVSEKAETHVNTATASATGKPTDPSGASVKPPAADSPTKLTAESAARAGAGTNGTTVAPNGERMKFVAEQNKIAGMAPQKLPPVTSVSSAAAIKTDAPSAKIRLPIDFSARDNAPEQLSLTSAKATALNAPASVAASASVQAPSQVDRVEQLITREAISFKSSGANEVGVSLKIDAHTQLFLQLSYRDGQTQAVLRCEKGDAPALSAHFGQLQESLARQNIQLQSSNSGFDLGRQGSSGRPWQDPAQRQDSPVKVEAKSTSSNKTNAKPVSRQGWETWA
jgi:hypothetical protein